LIGAGLVAAVAIQVYLNSTILDWWGSAAFGQRRLCNVSLPLVVGLASLLWRCGQLARRWPRARHAIAIAILAPFVAWNLGRVGSLRGGVSAPDAVAPACCERVPGPLRPAFAAVYAAIGDPFELPASAWFAWRHGVPIDRWDHTVGMYPLVPALDSLLDDSLWVQRGAWHIASPQLAPFLVDGWSAPSTTGRASRTTTAPATVLVPNLLPYPQQLTLWLAPAGAHHAIVRWNGAIVADVELTAWTPVALDVHDLGLHANELTIEPAGIAVGDLEIALRRPDQ
jgi:hypothetical protein